MRNNNSTISQVPFTSVELNDNFWKPRLETNRTVTIPYVFKRCEETGRIDNFRKAAGFMQGEHVGLHYNDSDVFKALEAAAYSLATFSDDELETYIDSIIDSIEAAQADDGYLYTARQLGSESCIPAMGKERWSFIRQSHELYNMGHMYEAAIAYYQATGKRKFLDVCVKNAELIGKTFGPEGSKIQDKPGHQEIELALVKLYNVTHTAEYLELARFFLDRRGHGEEGIHDGERLKKQNHKIAVEQDEAEGHAVRAGYMYAAMADVALYLGDKAYENAVGKIWANVISKKIYVTGGIGSHRFNEIFGTNYELPNVNSYAETCAAIANALWNYRMFLLTGEAKYIDVMERAIYNGFLCGVSLSGDRFFYANPMCSDGVPKLGLRFAQERVEWFNTSCCPTNIVRFMASLPGYFFATKEDSIYVNLYAHGNAKIGLGARNVALAIDSCYPYDGKISIKVQDIEGAEDGSSQFCLKLRVPGWAVDRPVPSDLYFYKNGCHNEIEFLVNGERVDAIAEKGYVSIDRKWCAGDVVEFVLPMEPRRVLAHKNVENDRGKVAIERGPLVYCAEWADNDGDVFGRAIFDDMELRVVDGPDDLKEVKMIEACSAGAESVKLIPYCLWANRGRGQMAVWMPRVV